MSPPLVVSRENAALTHEAHTSIQPEESPLVVSRENAGLRLFSIAFARQNRRLTLLRVENMFFFVQWQLMYLVTASLINFDSLTYAIAPFSQTSCTHCKK